MPRENKKKGIKEYESNYVTDSFRPWSYSIYSFGIDSLMDNNQSARVLLNYNCGWLCGHGSLLTLRRSPSGEWWVVEVQMTWIS
jgi:hypothetical protein